VNVLDLTYQMGLWARQHPDLLLYGTGGFLAFTLGVPLLIGSVWVLLWWLLSGCVCR